MDEVDKIIVHSLRQVGCSIDDTDNLSNFTPELLVRAVSTCLCEINPSLSLPRTLPPGMAQRFTVASALAEACASCNYRGDIGYQTFLYPNAVDVRRLLMFLIEQLPKDSRRTAEPLTQGPMSKFELLRKQIHEKMNQQLKLPWVPQYCRGVSNRRLLGCSSQSQKFAPQLNLNTPAAGEISKEVRNYFQQHAPNIFQQTSREDFDLISSVLHKNDMDRFNHGERIDSVRYTASALIHATNLKHPQAVEPNSEASPPSENVSGGPTATLTPLEHLSEEVNMLKQENDNLLLKRKQLNVRMSELKQRQAVLQARIEELGKDVKLHERTCVVLANPDENVSKLESLITAALERRKVLEQQWQSYRQPMLTQLSELETIKQARNVLNVSDLHAIIEQLEQTYRDKSTHHNQLSSQLQKAGKGIASRKEYTHRILEFIGNIRKQRNDIFKVLEDTRDLQKQLNSVTGQLQRQFNYTDDLLFQSAKHDLHAKKAYKLLATLHTTCNELIDLVSKTGNVTKEIRDLEVQIDREKVRNVAFSLEQISADIRNFENVIKSIQTEISKVENKISIA